MLCLFMSALLCMCAPVGVYNYSDMQVNHHRAGRDSERLTESEWSDETAGQRETGQWKMWEEGK